MDTIEAQKNLSEQDLTIFNAELDRTRKSPVLAYVLWFFFGSIGAHQFYMGKVGRAVLYIALGVCLWWSIVSGVMVAAVAENPDQGAAGGAAMWMLGGLAVMVLGLLLLIDLFTIPSQIRKREDGIRAELLGKLGAG